MDATTHIPVLQEEVLMYLAPRPGLLYVDATLGGGGHARTILERIVSGPDDGSFLIGLDQDPGALERARQRLSEYAPHTMFLHSNFSQITEVLSCHGRVPVTGGILADIGVSSFQLDEAERGFSFRHDAPLDMRMDTTRETTAAQLLNSLAVDELSRIFSEYGEERFSKTIAQEIVHRRTEHPIESTGELAELVASIHQRFLKGKAWSGIHPATQVFQALRIAVNDELGVLSRFLEQLPALLAPGARVVIISFHSLEDRIVKRFFQAESRDCICPPRFPVCQCDHRARFKVLTPKPVTPTREEEQSNPRSRSAKLRAFERL